MVRTHTNKDTWLFLIVHSAVIIILKKETQSHVKRLNGRQNEAWSFNAGYFKRRLTILGLM